MSTPSSPAAKKWIGPKKLLKVSGEDASNLAVGTFCMPCNHDFRYKSSIERHLLRHRADRESLMHLRCERCDRAFDREDAFARHAERCGQTQKASQHNGNATRRARGAATSRKPRTTHNRVPSPSATAGGTVPSITRRATVTDPFPANNNFSDVASGDSGTVEEHPHPYRHFSLLPSSAPSPEHRECSNDHSQTLASMAVDKWTPPPPSSIARSPEFDNFTPAYAYESCFPISYVRSSRYARPAGSRSEASQIPSSHSTGVVCSDDFVARRH